VKNTGTFIKTVLPADGNSIVTIADFNQILAPYQFLVEAGVIIEHALVLEDFQAKLGLFSLSEAGWPNVNAISTDAEKEAELAKIKKEGQKIYLGCYHAYGSGPWQKKGEEILQNKNGLEQPWTLMAPYFSTNATALLDEDLKIGIRVEPKAEGNEGGLKQGDYITVFGAWKKITNKENIQMLINPNTAVPNSTNSPANSSGAVKNDLTATSSLIASDRTATKNRKDLFLHNASSSPDSVLINYGTTVSSSVYTAEILPGGSWRDFANSQGAVSARAKITTATLNVTEFVTLL
jgi:hypothetical protein